jgi:hypothetical protein
MVSEGILSIIPDNLLTMPGFNKRGWVPHHNEIAVDDVKKDDIHRLYKPGDNPVRNDKLAYANQFKWRKNAAIQHIRKVYTENKQKEPT